MGRMVFPKVGLVLACLVAHCQGRTRGYSMAFQGVNSVAGISSGIVDPEAQGIRDLKTQFTISAWVSYERGRLHGSYFQFGGKSGSSISLDFFGSSLAFEIEGELRRIECQLDFRRIPFPEKERWHYYTSVFDDGTIKNYVDGNLASVCPYKDWGLMEEAFSFENIRDGAFHLGSSFKGDYHGPIKSYARSMGNIHKAVFVGFLGKINEFGIWSRALDVSEIQSFSRSPRNVSDIPDDLIIYYNFDAHGCLGTIKHGPCGTCSGTGLIQNYGTAASDYDLLIGQLNNDYGYGMEWVEDVGWNSDYPIRHKFHKPTVCMDTPAGDPSIPDDPAIPSVVQVQGGEAAIRLSNANILLSVPESWIVRNTLGAQLLPGADLSDVRTLRFTVPDDFDQPVVCRIGVELNRTHEIHIWPFSRPRFIEETSGLKNNILDIFKGEGNYLVSGLKDYAMSDTGEDLDLRVTHFPRNANLRTLKIWEGEVQGGFVTYVQYKELGPGKDRAVNMDSLLIRFDTMQSFHGVDFMEVVYVSKSSGQESEPLKIRLTTLLKDDSPTSEGSLITVEEDSPGSSITLQGDDEERIFGLLFAVETLPAKGTLYKWEDGRRVAIDQPHSIFQQAGSPLEQFVHKVRSVSSFPTASRLHFFHHPMHIIGKGSCKRDFYNYCYMLTESQGWGAKDWVGEIVLANIYSSRSYLSNPSKTSLFLPARVIDTEMTVEFMPTFKLVDGKPTQCIGPPEACSTELVRNKSFTLSGAVFDTDLKIPRRTVWSPAVEGYLPDVVLDGGNFSGYLGEEYRFMHNQSIGYTSSERYTEFIEVEFEQAVFPIAVEIGSPFGGGGIVNIKALDPRGGWVKLYSGKAQLRESLEAELHETYFYFDEPLCRQNFKTNVLRLELDTSGSGIGTQNAIEFVKLVGVDVQQSAVLEYGNQTVEYVPRPGSYGVDSFTFKTWDCGGKARRGSKEATVEIHIAANADAPVIETQQIVHRVFCSAVTGLAAANVTLFAKEIDDEDITVDFLKLPQVGVIAKSELNRIGVDRFQLEIQYVVENCLDPLLRPGVQKIHVRVTDTAGNSSDTTVALKFVREHRHLAHTGKKLALGLFATNAILCGLCAWVTLRFKDGLVVKAAQAQFLFMFVSGAFISSSTILTLAVDDGIDGQGKEYADMACVLSPWFYTTGFMLTFTPLYVKMYRVSRVFQVSFAGDDTISNRSLLQKIGLFWSVDGALCLVWTLVEPMKFTRVPLIYDEVYTDVVVQSVGSCFGSQLDVYMIAIIACYHLLMLSYVAYYCYQTLDVNDAFSEAKYLRIAIGSSLQILLFALPIIIMVSDGPNTDVSLFIRASVIWLNDFSVLAFIFLPKLYMMRYGIAEGGLGSEQLMAAQAKKDRAHKTATSSPSSGRTSTPSRGRVTPITSGGETPSSS